MSKISIQPELLKTLFSELRTADLENFVQIILGILANRKKESKTVSESDLLLKINNCKLPEGHLERFLSLKEKREIQELPENELKEYFFLIEEEQKLQLERIKLLKNLADVKGITVKELMRKLEITAPESV